MRSNFFSARLHRDLLSILLLVGAFFQVTHASVIIDGTRVIYPAEAKEVSVRLTNKGEAPRLIQAWIDEGDEKSSPEKIDVPFVILTPIFRMEANKGHVLRLRYTHNKPLPSDRESVFWLNVLEIPAKVANGKGENYLQFAFRTRIKIFLRPAGLPGTALKAQESLVWKYKPGALSITNPSAFHVSIKHIEVGDKNEGGSAANIMVAPYTTEYVSLRGQGTKLNSPKIKFYPVNDYGGTPALESKSVNAEFNAPAK